MILHPAGEAAVVYRDVGIEVMGSGALNPDQLTPISTFLCVMARSIVQVDASLKAGEYYLNCVEILSLLSAILVSSYAPP